ncbi:MAG: Stk1 family PASTA domain-containing Ser/Thr kinase [Acidimicrobiia bacterium]
MALDARVFSGRYEIKRQLARGGMADVYLARDQLLDRAVALKVLFSEFARDPSFVERFRREAQAAANLNHPNIVGIYDWGEEDGTYFIVMEYVEGRSLRDVLRSEGLLPARQAAEIGAEIAAALAFAHHAGVVHRDVKPGNVLITPTGEVKVTDFGIARAGTSESLTQTGAVMGTATYFSPEQAQGLAVDGRSDVYSLGVVLYEMVCGVPPFTGESPVSVAYKHVRETAVPPSQRVPDLPHEFEQIVLNSLEKDPAERYASADDLRDDLLRFHRGRPIAARPVTAIVTEVTGPVSAAGEPTVAAPTTRPSNHDSYLPPTKPDTARRRAGVAVAVALLLGLLGVIVALIVTQVSGSGSKTATVPDVTSSATMYPDAKRQMEAVGFHVARQNEPNESVPEGQVIAQSPNPNTKLKKGETVTLTVSSGVGQTTVPNIVGMLAQDAKITLQNKGLEPKDPPILEESDKPVGTVLRTDPAAGKKVSKGSKIGVVLAVTPQVTVVDVTGGNAVDAANQLGRDGFDTKVVDEPSDTVLEGNVTRTDPKAGAKAPKGSTVTIYVSSGPDAAVVPNVQGESEAQARADLAAAGFTNVTTVDRPTTPPNDGKVIGQVPTDGTRYPKSQTVTLQIGRATVPNTGSTTTAPTSSP